MTPEDSKVAVLENRMLNLETRFTETDSRIARSMEGIERSVASIEKMLGDHGSDLRILNEERQDRKNIYKMLMAAIIGAVIEPILMFVAFWFLFGQKIMAVVTTNGVK